MRPSHEPTNIQPLALAEEAARAVRGGTASLADVERRLAPYFERTEPRRRGMSAWEHYPAWSSQPVSRRRASR
jgi:hypothetical protein